VLPGDAVRPAAELGLALEGLKAFGDGGHRAGLRGEGIGF
jgi:hypothetical protein